MIYALIFALGSGAAAGYLRAPSWTVAVGGLIATSVFVWFERDALRRAAPDNPLRRNLLMAAAYAFVVMVAVSLTGVAYGISAWLHK